MSQKYSGGFITKSPVAPTSSAASGIWTLDQQQQAKQAGNWPSPPMFIEDLFSTYLYTGNGTTQTITNNIDLAGKGGLVWIKVRNHTWENILTDTVRGATIEVVSNATYANITNTDDLTSFTSSGFSVGNGNAVNQGSPGRNYVSWTFREQPKFFDIVTYTGTGSNTTIAHSLGSVPGCIMVKRTDTSSAWAVYHRSLANTQYMVLNTTAAVVTGATWWNSTTPTSSVFSVGTDASVNASGGTYVAYLFAHDAGGFGLTGTDNVISCGSYTGTGAAGNDISLGYEPQWLLIKNSAGAFASVNNWTLYDVMRGFDNSADNILRANTSGAEIADTAHVVPTSTGFTLTTSGSGTNGSGATYIYIAIRRGPMKVPTTGTSVFTTDAAGDNASANGEAFSSTFPLDFHFRKDRISAGNDWFSNSRLVPSNSLKLNTTAAEVALAYVNLYDRMTGIGTTTAFNYTDWAGWLFRRAPSFFDVVCYTGTGATANVTHNLSAVPELMIVKRRDGVNDWYVYSNAAPQPYGFTLNSSDAASAVSVWANTTPTSTVFTVSGNAAVGGSGATYVAYLFATVAGVSKVGSYTGTAALLTVDCGFTSGARFVLIKRSDSTGAWYVWDSARGITAGDDPYLLLNSTAAEVTNTNYVDTDTTGFKVTAAAPAAINANGGTFIFLAIA